MTPFSTPLVHFSYELTDKHLDRSEALFTCLCLFCVKHLSLPVFWVFLPLQLGSSVYGGCVRPTWKKASSADWNRGLPPACCCALVHLVRKVSSKCLPCSAERLPSKRICVGIAAFSARTETSVTSCATSLSRYLCISAPTPTTVLMLSTMPAKSFHIFKDL